MPLIFTAEYEAEIGGTDYVVLQKLTLGLPAGGYSDFTRNIQQVSLGLEMTTPFPDGVRDVVGYSSLGGDITLSGQVDPSDDDKTVGWLLNPDSTDSPLYRLSINNATVAYEWGLRTVNGDETLLKFGGWVRGAEFPEGGLVVLHVADLDPNWDKTPLLEPVVTAPPYNAGLTPEFCRDRLIRAMDGDSSWPAIRSHCILAVGLRTSLWPEVGTLNTTLTQPDHVFVPGPYGTGLGNTNTFDDSQWDIGVVYGLAGAVSDHLFIECFVSDITLSTLGQLDINIGALSGHALGENIQLQIDSDGVNATIPGAGSVTNFGSSLAGGPDYVGVHFAFSGGSCTATGTVDGDTFTHTVTFTGTPSTWDTATISGSDAGAIAGVQVTTESSPTPNNTWAPHAILDPSTNTLTAVPQIDKGSSPWDELQTMDAAEGGYIRRMPDGTIRFLNRYSIANQPLSTIPVTASTNLKPGMGSSLPPASAYRTITVPFTPWKFATSPTLLWQLTDAMVKDWKVPGNTTRTFVVDLDSGTLAGTVDASVGKLGTGADPTDGTASHYLASRDPDGLTAHGNFGPVTAQLLSPSRLQITATNPTSLPAYFVVPSSFTGIPDAGTPALWVSGTVVTQGSETTVTVGDGPGVLPVDSNAYLQNYDDAHALGEWLLEQLAFDIRDFTGSMIIPDATIEPVDVVPLTGTAASMIADYARVWGWQLSMTAPPPGGGSGTFEETLSLRALGPPGAWLLGIPGRSEIGDADDPDSGTAYLYATT